MCLCFKYKSLGEDDVLKISVVKKLYMVKKGRGRGIGWRKNCCGVLWLIYVCLNCSDRLRRAPWVTNLDFFADPDLDPG